MVTHQRKKHESENQTLSFRETHSPTPGEELYFIGSNF